MRKIKIKDTNYQDIENKYLVDLLNSEIDNEEKIVSNASNSCHKCKTFFVSFMIPFLATCIGTFFNIYDKNSDLFLFIYFIVLFGILFLLLVIEILIHKSFYLIQYKHRHVLSSLYLLKGNAIRYNIKINLKFDYEALKKIEKIVELRAAKTKSKGFVFDTFPYTIPLSILVLLSLFLAISYGAFCLIK